MREAIVIAGGLGTRLKKIVPNLPKPMAPVAGRPFLEILLLSLAHKGVSRVIISTGYMAEKISSHFGANFAGMDLVYVIEDIPLGTGGAVRLAMEKCKLDHVFVFNGDTFIDLELDALDQQWHKNQRPIIVARQVTDTTRYGRLLVASDKVIGFTEKGLSGTGLVNAGCYVFNKNQLEEFALNHVFSLEVDYLSQIVSDSFFEVFVTSGKFIDIGVPEDYYLAQNMLALQ